VVVIPFDGYVEGGLDIDNIIDKLLGDAGSGKP